MQANFFVPENLAHLRELTLRESATQIDAADQRPLAGTLKLANDLGATVFTFKGEDVAATILRFARARLISSATPVIPTATSGNGRLARRPQLIH